MTQEEKAEAYDEVREKIALRFGSNVAEEIFSGFEKSEDERVREALVEIFSLVKENKKPVISKEDAELILAWLEKEGNSNNQNWKPSKEQINALEHFVRSIAESGYASPYDDNTKLLKSLINDLHKLEKQKDINALIQQAYKQGYTEGQRIERKHWLKKQGESNLIEEIKRRKELFSQEKEKAVSSSEKLSLGGRIAMLEELLVFVNEKQDEQKFHEGDWIVDNCGNVWKIEGILNQFYVLECVEGGESRPTIEWVDKTFHRWTIDDAKDGDILYSPTHHLIWIYKDDNHFYACINLNYTSYNVSIDGTIYIPNDVCPVTKEQRNLLFQKMKEAGYEWDIEKKELKKINEDGVAYKKQIMSEIANLAIARVKQKPESTWSEEDNYNLQCMIAKVTSDIQKGNVGRNNELINWLKSLKDRVQPQPRQWGDEDIRNIQDIDSVLFYSKDLPEETCIRLRNWVKSLKERMREESDGKVDSMVS